MSEESLLFLSGYFWTLIKPTNADPQTLNRLSVSAVHTTFKKGLTNGTQE